MHIDFVIAKSEEDACKIVYNKWGHAKSYSLNATNYWAKEV